MSKVLVSERAFLARMKRHLMNESLTLHQGRETAQGYGELGRFYTVATLRNVVEHKGLDLDDLEKWAREVGVLKPYEIIHSA